MPVSFLRRLWWATFVFDIHKSPLPKSNMSLIDHPFHNIAKGSLSGFETKQQHQEQREKHTLPNYRSADITSPKYWLIGITWPCLIAPSQHVTHQSQGNLIRPWFSSSVTVQSSDHILCPLLTQLWAHAQSITTSRSSWNAKPPTVCTFICKKKKRKDKKKENQQRNNSALRVRLERTTCFHLEHFVSSTDRRITKTKVAAKWLLWGSVTPSESKW